MADNVSRADTKFDLWERKLLDLSTRNSLLNIKLKGSTIPLFVTSSATMENSIADDAEYAVISRNSAGKNEQNEPLIPVKEYGIEDLCHCDGFKDVLDKAYTDKKIFSPLTESELEDSIKKLYRESRVSLDEDGSGSLFLACGILKWIDEKKESTCYAPIVLVPVELTRKFGVGKYMVHKFDDDTIVNITLMEKLKQDFDIDIPELAGPLPADEHGTDVNGVLDTIRGAVSHKPDWEVIDACVLGLFKFSQFVMWKDMRSFREQIASNKIVNSLLEGRLTFPYEDMEKDGVNFNDESSVFLPISADKSQLYAIYKASHVEQDEDGKDVVRNSSFVLHGPPGTGKSQTITSIIANAVANGQKVLFAAEKKAALDVVYSRLEKIGIAPFCLELHSNKATKSYILDQIKEAYEKRREALPDSDYDKERDDIKARRAELQTYIDELTRPLSYGYSLYEIMNIYESNKNAPDVLPENGFEEGLTAEKIRAAESSLQELISSSRGLTGKLTYVKATDYSQDTKIKLIPELQELDSAADALDKALTSVKSSYPSIDQGSDADACARIRSVIDRFFQARSKILTSWTLDFLAVDAGELKASYDTASNKWGPLRSGALKKVYNTVKAFDKTGSADKDLLTHIKELQTYQDEFRRYGLDTSSGIPSVLPEFINAHDTFNNAVNTVNGRLGITASALSDLTRIRAVISDLTANETLIRPKILMNKAAANCEALNIRPLVEAFGKGTVKEDELIPAFHKSWSKLIICRTIDDSEILRNFSGDIFDDKISKLKSLSDEFEGLTRREIYRRIASTSIIPDMENANKDSMLGRLQRAIKSRGRGVSIRTLLKEVEEVVLQLTPCVLMSPMSAAQFIEPSTEPLFDLVIFDEASQIPTCKAVGVLARGKDAIIVGDPNQMPPTSFFREQVFDEDNYDTEDLESILDDCLAVGMPESRLLWHYRSRHESLITFSNRSFYEGKLYTFPSVDDLRSQVTLRKIDGVFDSGKTRTNEAEAKAVVEELKTRSRDEIQNKLSYGIVTFNIQQQTYIEDLIDEACKADETFEKWAYGSEESIFIKNLENVQGDERDVILFSVGYGPDQEGKVSMNFGPLNRDGGWRRLNVAATRSRCEMVVFTSLQPEQIKVTDATPEGVKAFRRFLMYAGGNTLWGEGLPDPSGASASPFADIAKNTGLTDNICKALNDKGYETVKNIGKSGFKIDIGVLTPGKTDSYCLGILIDGSSSGNFATATAREVSQPAILKGLGWKVIKIWSIDWWEDPDKVIRSCIDAINGTEEPKEPVSEETSPSEEDSKKN